MAKLSDSIWVTRKCHINAEQRLIRASLVANITLTAYSTYLVIASVIAMKKTLDNFEIVSLVGSLLVVIASVFVWGLRFSDRASNFKTSYIRMQLLLSECTKAEEANNLEAIDRINRSYADILHGCENHSSADYLKLRFALKDQPQKTIEGMTTLECWGYFGMGLLRALLLIGMIGGPAAALYWYVCGF